MKIGIITFHFPVNYGAMIQAYAMQEHLRMMGHEVFIIDYAPEYHMKTYTGKRSWRWCLRGGFRSEIPDRILSKFFDGLRQKRNANFFSFMKSKFRLYPYKPEDDMSFFDCILLGSDQIWNQRITNNCFDGPYYGDGFKCRVFSYAASNRSKELNEEEKAQYRVKLNQLQSIGVRELQLQKLLQPLTDKPVYMNVDPTMLAHPSVYDNLDLSRPMMDKYVVIYELTNHKKVQKMADRYAKKNGAKVVILVNDTSLLYGKKYDQEANPEKFLAYIKNAECVFTTSFHGTALSMVFKKDFYSVRQGNSADIRLESILTQVGQLDRFISMDAVPEIAPVDYSKIDDRLAEMRAASQDYLEKSIAGTI
ncbi:MAG: polysaccharide pyruvyl transferase family protein [Bacteroidaceae bacterium]|nr:polysaccharide pyruvyl transferase family protein [Bacteroidaceae bacterium]